VTDETRFKISVKGGRSAGPSARASVTFAGGSRRRADGVGVGLAAPDRTKRPNTRSLHARALSLFCEAENDRISLALKIARRS
jgi:hypothetical protein